MAIINSSRYNSLEVVAFSNTDGVDTHHAYRKGVPSGLFKLLNKLNVCGITAGTGVYTVPLEGYYHIAEYNGNGMNSVNIKHLHAGDVVTVYNNIKVCIHRLGP